MNVNETPKRIRSAAEIDASCRVPLLALFGGAALWLVVGSLLGLAASIKFHAPDISARLPVADLRPRCKPAADDALLYGFCIPAGLGVVLWIFARLGQTPLRGRSFRSSRRISGISACWSAWSAFCSATAPDLPGSNFRAAVRRCCSSRYLLLGAVGASMNFRPARASVNCIRRTGFWSRRCFWFPWIYSTANCSARRHGRCAAWCRPSSRGGLATIWSSSGRASSVLARRFISCQNSAGRPLQTYYLRAVRVLDAAALRLDARRAGRARRCRRGCRR